MQESKFTFKLLGRHNGWWALRAPTWPTAKRGPVDACHFESAVSEWLLNEATGEWHLGNGDAPGYPKLPMAFSTGSGLCLLLKRADDLLRFNRKFKVNGLSPEALALAA